MGATASMVSMTVKLNKRLRSETMTGTCKTNSQKKHAPYARSLFWFLVMRQLSGHPELRQKFTRSKIHILLI